MKNKTIFIIIFSFFGFLIFSSLSSFSQEYEQNEKRFFDNWRININGGLNMFYGDIQQYKFLPYEDDYRYAYGISLHKQISPVISFGGQLINGKLHGTRINETTNTGVNFDSKVFEYNLNSTINFSNLFGGFNEYRKFYIYGLAGIGFSNWETEVKDYVTGEVLRKSGFVGSGPNKRTTEIVIPVGIGFKFNLSNSIGINFQHTTHGVNSDRLDATVNGRKYDYYNYTSLGLSYNFNSLNISLGNPDKRQAKYQKRIEKEARRDMSAYQDKAKLDKRKADRRDLEDNKREQREQYKKIKSERRSSYQGQTPKAVEYDIVSIASYSSSKTKNSRDNIGIERIDMDAPPVQKETIIDEAKFIITGNKPSTSNTTYNSNQTTITPQTEFIQQAQIPETGVVFRVQIMAKYQKRINIQQLANSYNINETIAEEYINGYYKYTAGLFYNYNNAVDYKNILKNKGISGAFIIAYKNGVRVPLNTVR